MSNATNDVRKLVTKAVSSAAASPNLAIQQSDVPAVSERVVAEVAPAIEHLTNTEGWYKSRVVWGVLIAAASTVAKPIAGEVFDAVQTQDIVDAFAAGGQLFGFGLTMYGRWIAKKPIGG